MFGQSDRKRSRESRKSGLVRAGGDGVGSQEPVCVRPRPLLGDSGPRGNAGLRARRRPGSCLRPASRAPRGLSEQSDLAKGQCFCAPGCPPTVSGERSRHVPSHVSTRGPTGRAWTRWPLLSCPGRLGPRPHGPSWSQGQPPEGARGAHGQLSLSGDQTGVSWWKQEPKSSVCV